MDLQSQRIVMMWKQALQFVDDLLSEEIHNLRFWGVEGEDYQVGDDGLFL